MPLHVTLLSRQFSRNYHLPPDWELHTPINILTLRNPYIQSVRSLSPRRELTPQNIEISSHRFSAHPGKPAPLSGRDNKGIFPKTTNINLISPNVHAVGGLRDFTTKGPLLESPDNFSGPKSCSMFAVFVFKMSFNNFENNKVKSSVNEAKLTGFWTTCKNCAFR